MQAQPRSVGDTTCCAGCTLSRCNSRAAGGRDEESRAAHRVCANLDGPAQPEEVRTQHNKGILCHGEAESLRLGQLPLVAKQAGVARPRAGRALAKRDPSAFSWPRLGRRCRGNKSNCCPKLTLVARDGRRQWNHRQILHDLHPRQALSSVRGRTASPLSVQTAPRKDQH